MQFEQVLPLLTSLALFYFQVLMACNQTYSDRLTTFLGVYSSAKSWEYRDRDQMSGTCAQS